MRGAPRGPAWPLAQRFCVFATMSGTLFSAVSCCRGPAPAGAGVPTMGRPHCIQRSNDMWEHATMEDALSTIAVLTKSGYRLTLYRSPSGRRWADLRRGWILRKYVRVNLDPGQFEQVKQMLGPEVTRKRVREG
jgi:hypothetical protein